MQELSSIHQGEDSLQSEFLPSTTNKLHLYARFIKYTVSKEDCSQTCKNSHAPEAESDMSLSFLRIQHSLDTASNQLQEDP